MAILTIGHSNHEAARFVELLRGAGIGQVVDVRSQPYSRYAPHFNQSSLKGLLHRSGIGYRHEPDLGGRPEDPALYDRQGHVLYGDLAGTEGFRSAIDRLESTIRTNDRPVVILCGEEDPSDCHRRLLVGRVLQKRGWDVEHIRGDGRTQGEPELSASAGPLGETGLFEEGEFSTWRSTRSVSPRSQPPGSSAS